MKQFQASFLQKELIPGIRSFWNELLPNTALGLRHYCVPLCSVEYVTVTKYRHLHRHLLRLSPSPVASEPRSRYDHISFHIILCY